MAAKTAAQKKAEAEAKAAAEQAEADRREALTQEERDAEDAAAAEAKNKKDSKTTVSVQFAGGVREFTKDIHGEDFEAVADEFATTHNGTIL